MTSVALRLVLAPTLIAAASLAGRRWGPTISGWLIGLPLNSGPISFLLALSYGTAFAATAARGTLAGTFSLAVFCLAYAWTARWRGWPLAIVTSILAFGVVTVALQYLTLPLPLLVGCVLAALLVTLGLMPKPVRRSALIARAIPRWDLPARMLVAAVFVLLLTGAASLLGPHLTGLITPFPVYALILAVFTHHQEGGAATANVLRGLLVGMLAFIGFFLVIATLLERLGIGVTFTLAILVALLIQMGTLWLLRRRAQAQVS